MQVEIVPFHAMHVELMDLREQERSYIEHLPDWRERVRFMQQGGNAITGLIDGRPVACGGVNQLWAGTSELWMLTDYAVETYPAVCARVARRVVDAVATADGCRRVQIAVRLQDLRALRFANFLQFEPEGVLKAYGPDGSDYVMMARVDDGRIVRGRRRGQPAGHADAADGDAGPAAGKA